MKRAIVKRIKSELENFSVTLTQKECGVIYDGIVDELKREIKNTCIDQTTCIMSIFRVKKIVRKARKRYNVGTEKIETMPSFVTLKIKANIDGKKNF